MSRVSNATRVLMLVIAAIIVAGAGWYVFNAVQERKEHEAFKKLFIAQIEVIEIKPSDKGKLPVIRFNLTGTQPTSREIATLDLIKKDTASYKDPRYFDVTVEPRFGINEIDLNTNTKGIPSGRYELRMIYSVPRGTLADTTVAAVSEEFEIK